MGQKCKTRTLIPDVSIPSIISGMESLPFTSSFQLFLQDFIVRFGIEIYVPKSLGVWYLTLFWFSLFVISINLFEFVNQIYFALGGEALNDLNYAKTLVENEVFIHLPLALIGGIIATRGWLISEETILSRYSNYLTLFLVLLIILPLLLKSLF